MLNSLQCLRTPSHSNTRYSSMARLPGAREGQYMSSLAMHARVTPLCSLLLTKAVLYLRRPRLHLALGNGKSPSHLRITRAMLLYDVFIWLRCLASSGGRRHNKFHGAKCLPPKGPALGITVRCVTFFVGDNELHNTTNFI